MTETKKEARPDANRDPMTGASGAHPVGVGLGSMSGATIGAVVGAAAGPAATALGAAIGGLAGGLTGKGLAEAAGVSPVTCQLLSWSIL
jgi:phage tail tape-measure protein